jgi:hypothetical protein
MDEELLSFVCPRCTTGVAERLYGPCADCRQALRSSVRGEAREVDAAVYEPKMNVTPNAVAVKD